MVDHQPRPPLIGIQQASAPVPSGHGQTSPTLLPSWPWLAALPMITLAEEGIPTELAYTGAKSTIRHIVSTNFARGVEWGTLSKAEQEKVINHVKGAF